MSTFFNSVDCFELDNELATLRQNISAFCLYIHGSSICLLPSLFGDDIYTVYTVYIYMLSYVYKYQIF